MIACKIFGMFLFSLIVDWNISFLGFAHLPQKRLKEVQQRRHRYGPHQITWSAQWAKLIWVFLIDTASKHYSLSLSPPKKKMHYINYNSSSKFKSELRDNCGDYVYCNNFIAPIKSVLATIQYYLSCKTYYITRCL